MNDTAGGFKNGGAMPPLPDTCSWRGALLSPGTVLPFSTNYKPLHYTNLFSLPFLPYGGDEMYPQIGPKNVALLSDIYFNSNLPRGQTQPGQL
jgi:hypothetical protein